MYIGARRAVRERLKNYESGEKQSKVFAHIHTVRAAEVVAAAAHTHGLPTVALAAVLMVDIATVALLFAAALVVAVTLVVVALAAARLLFADAAANAVALVAGRIEKEHINTSERLCKERIWKVPTLLAYSVGGGSVTNKPKENA